MADVAFFLVSLVAALAIVPARWRAITVLTVVWTVLFRVFRRSGYGFLAINASAVFWLLLYADQLNFPELPRETALGYLAFTAALFAVVVVLHQSLDRPARHLAPLVAGAASIVLSTAASLYIWHQLKFKIPIGPDMFFAAYQTNPREFVEFVATYGDNGWVAGVLIILGLGALSAPLSAAPRVAIRRVGWAIPAVLALAVLIPRRNALRVLDDLTTTAVTSADTYHREVRAFRELQQKRAAGTSVVHATKEGRGETYVLVIGESLNRNHMSLYGYHRNTTPMADSLQRAGDVLTFTNAYATAVNTNPVLSVALTAANQKNGIEFFKAPSIIDVARAAGFETHWVTNQLLYGGWDNAVSVLAHGVDHLVPLNRNVGETANTHVYDEAAIPALESILAARTDRNRLIVVHLMGSHMAYCQRFPESFRRFTGPLSRGEFGRAAREDKRWDVNCYDNSVLYSDHVVARLLQATRKQGNIAALLYVADHGEDVIAKRGHYRGRFTYGMVEVPLVVWASEAYQRAYEGRFASLRAHTDVVFASDFLFDTVLGIAGVVSSYQDSLLDLSHPRYGQGAFDHTILQGMRRFLDSTNVRYYQRRNIARLAALGLRQRVVPHRVNSTGKLAEVLYDGYRSLELDLIYRAGPSPHFEVGHDNNSASGNELEAFLARLPALEKVWLDVKNLTPDNVGGVRTELARLDRRFGLKQPVIFESRAAEVLPAVEQDGFHTSYYLPTDRLLDLGKRAAGDSLAAEARRIAGLVRGGRLGAVSFDARLYPFVKTYVEPLIAEDVMYHTWDTPLSLADPAFQDKLAGAQYFADPRVRTILVSYESALTL